MGCMEGRYKDTNISVLWSQFLKWSGRAATVGVGMFSHPHFSVYVDKAMSRVILRGITLRVRLGRHIKKRVEDSIPSLSHKGLWSS